MVETAPAGGAAATQVLFGSIAAGVLVTALLVLGIGHRSGRLRVLDRAAAPLSRITGLPGWAVLPAAVAVLAFLAAGPGFVWDVALHIDKGRDEGPFANPSHYLLLLGVFGFIAAGWLAVVMPKGDVGPSGVRLGRDWVVPVGAVAMMATGSFSALGFPLDDLWHRLFGQDVTLWGPTHLMMITGGVLHYCSMVVLVREGRLATRAAAPPGRPRPWATIALDRVFGVLTGVVVLTGLTLAYQQEFAFGVPQFRLAFQPLLIALSAGIALVWMRVALGRGAALAAVVIYIGLECVLAVLVGPLLGEATMHFPLYITEALLVEIAGAALGRRRPYRLAVAAGFLIGTAGVLAEWGWSQLWMPIPWTAGLLPEALLLGTVAGVAGGILGAFAGSALRGRVPAGRRPWMAPAAALAALVVVIVPLLQSTLPPGARAQVTLTDAAGSRDREAYATVRFDPPGVADDADWLVGLAWQGGEPLVVTPLRRLPDGSYRSERPLPVHGSWKTALRFHRGSQMGSVPVHLPADAGIPAPAIPAPARFERPLGADRSLMQRERKPDVPGWLWTFGSSLVAALTLALLGVLGWSLLRLARGGPGRSAGGRPRLERRLAALLPRT